MYPDEARCSTVSAHEFIGIGIGAAQSETMLDRRRKVTDKEDDAEKGDVLVSNKLAPRGARG